MNKKCRQKSVAVLAGFFFLFFVIVSAALAAETPVLPTILKGTVLIDNSPAPIGTEITATIGGVLLGEQNTTQEGKYVIAVGGGSENNAKSIRLYVNGIMAENTNITWSSGSMNAQDIAIATKNNILYYILAGTIGFIIALAAMKRKKRTKK